MKKKHAKSPCCQGWVRRFGARRRQCSTCGKTWRSRPKRRGRRKKRPTIDFCRRYLKHELPSLWAKARAGHRTERQLQLALRRSRDQLLHQTDWPAWPRRAKTLVVIADAVIFKRQGRYFTLYLTLLKRPSEGLASITPGWWEPGRETQTGWCRALKQLPETVRAKVRAMVCDGHRGPVNYAKQHHWLIQRCHFHLLAAVQGRRSRWIKSRHYLEGRRIYALVERCLQTPDETTAETLVYQIEAEALATSSPQLRRILQGFVNWYEDYRQYRYHPELNLPTTTNAVESLNASIKSLTFRARGFGSLESLKKWLAALLKFKQKVTCNGHQYQPN